MRSRTTLLRQYLATRRKGVLRPGRRDCALFAADWVECCTGRDLTRGMRATYNSLAEGRAMLSDQGLADLGELAARSLPEIGGWMGAQVGDVALVSEAGEFCFGIVGGAHIHVLALRGLDVIGLSRAERVFRP